MQLEKLAPRMSHATDLDHTEFEAGLVTTKIITHQLAFPVLEEVACMLPGAARAEVINDSCCFAELAGGVGPDIGAVSFLCSGHQHLHRCFIGMNNLLPEYHVAQRIDQRLQLHARHANPLSQC
ncbi:hypothetical protein D3C76_1165650 [compost metagenome]